ncbi:putative oxygen-independent coproporphyrinogen III oxidase [Cyanobium sp. PCC 7001]|uniref:coproporphyrinogen-III oxidase family protein n=1 Tax=Cyanobium sp. PCC 7001 TaxID=180281 RepID=UPI0001805C01|nr:coproporphyrinogen-III oxidase family protein [Cyanobium sp. PCC 7001]EDY38816.1 putative oxygen-independent coproporphyrinogen III oxidase [Cyanobium sp. PCC 7001]
MPFPPRSAYLHIPFCHRRCFYCDFPIVPLGDRAGPAPGQPGAASIDAYLALLRREIGQAPGATPLSTVYFGGGTPSLLEPTQIGELVRDLRRQFGLAPGAEITLELDPASFDRQRLRGYLAAGVNRVSLGGQSFDDGVLQQLGRRHSGGDLREAAGWLRQAHRSGALGSWSLDLIQAVPGQTLPAWRQQLEEAIGSGAPHLSVYDLTIEPGTVFARRLEQGRLELPQDDLAADLMELTSSELAAAGYGRYEVSNHALPGHASRHNRVYWSGAGWWGFGMGATSAPWGQRQARPRTRDAYRAWLTSGAAEAGAGEAGMAEIGVDPGMPLDERLMVGLRRREGVRLPELLRQVGWDDMAIAAGLGRLRRQLEPWMTRGLLLEEGERWRLSDPEGLALSNAVLRELWVWWDGSGSSANAAGLPRPGPAPAAAVG